MHAISTTPLTSSFQSKLDLACAAAMGTPIWKTEMQELAERAGRLAAMEQLGMESALIDLADQGVRFSGGMTYRFFFERAFWANCPTNDPEQFFSVKSQGHFVEIESREVAGGHGIVVLHKSDAFDFFRIAARDAIRDYEQWGTNPCATGGSAVILRQEDLQYDDEADTEHVCNTPVRDGYCGRLFIDPDTHPSHGRLYFGEPGQELRQLGALLKLRPLVDTFLKAEVPSAADREAAMTRSASIRANTNGSCYLPVDGYCECCNSDTTLCFDMTGLHRMSITGCPVCGKSWCE